MNLAHGTSCGKLLLDILFYEKSYGHLSPEMEYLLDQHIKECHWCRQRVLGFRRALAESTIVRNFG
jgi:hypothetical protein